MFNLSTEFVLEIRPAPRACFTSRGRRLGFPLQEPLSNGLSPVENLPTDSDRWGTLAADLPFAQRVLGNFELLGHLGAGDEVAGDRQGAGISVSRRALAGEERHRAPSCGLSLGRDVSQTTAV